MPQPQASFMSWNGKVGEKVSIASLMPCAAEIVSGLMNVSRLGTGTPTPGTVLRGDGSWGPAAGGVWTVVKKLADTARVSDTVLSPDPDLRVTLAGGLTYVLRGSVRISTDATPDAKYSLSYSGTFSSVFVYHGYRQVTAAGNMNNPSSLAVFEASGDVFPTSVRTLANINGTHSVVFEVFITTTAPGVFEFNWAQDVSNPSPTTVRAGSYIEWFENI